MAEKIHTLPPANYTEDAVFEMARERIFFKTWQFACHASRIPSKGDYYCFSLFDQDLFIIRDADGGFRCFFNVCQHRGHPLLKNEGNTGLLVCPYHAWSYELDGRLRAAPGSKADPVFDASRICLSPIRVDSLCDFLFVNLDATAPPLAACFHGVEDAIRSHCPEIDERAFAHEFQAVEACNWLLAVENYNECYHCESVHRTFSTGVMDPGSFDIAVLEPGRCLHHSARLPQGSGAWYDTSGSDYASFFLWPAFSLQFYPSCANTYHWRPLSVKRTEIFRQFYSPDGSVGTDLQKVIDLDRETTFSEDLALLRNVQRGIGSRGYGGGPLIVNPSGGVQSEHSVAALQQWFRESIS